MEVTNHDHSTEGACTEMSKLWEPYREFRAMNSAGRSSLTAAFSHYMALSTGIGPEEIASAFDAGGDAGDREMILREIDFLAKIFVQGRIRTFARLAGGGDPVELPASAWEIDDATTRFATGRLNADHPHDPLATATHWILVDNADWDAAMEGLRDSLLPDDWSSPEADREHAPAIEVLHQPGTNEGVAQQEPGQAVGEPWRNEILSLAGVVKVTGLKRSTIYAKVAAGSFPKQISIHGSRKGWRRGEIQDWLDALTATTH